MLCVNTISHIKLRSALITCEWGLGDKAAQWCFWHSEQPQSRWMLVTRAWCRDMKKWKIHVLFRTENGCRLLAINRGIKWLFANVAQRELHEVVFLSNIFLIIFCPVLENKCTWCLWQDFHHFKCFQTRGCFSFLLYLSVLMTNIYSELCLNFTFHLLEEILIRKAR